MGWEGTGYGEVGVGPTRATINLNRQQPAKALTTFSKRCFARLSACPSGNELRARVSFQFFAPFGSSVPLLRSGFPVSEIGSFSFLEKVLHDRCGRQSPLLRQGVLHQSNVVLYRLWKYCHTRSLMWYGISHDAMGKSVMFSSSMTDLNGQRKQCHESHLCSTARSRQSL